MSSYSPTYSISPASWVSSRCLFPFGLFPHTHTRLQTHKLPDMPSEFQEGCIFLLVTTLPHWFTSCILDTSKSDPGCSDSPQFCLPYLEVSIHSLFYTAGEWKYIPVQSVMDIDPGRKSHYNLSSPLTGVFWRLTPPAIQVLFLSVELLHVVFLLWCRCVLLHHSLDIFHPETHSWIGTLKIEHL